MDVFGNYEIRSMSLDIGPQSNLPQSALNNIYQYSNTTTLLRGRHAVKFGVDVRNMISSSSFLPRARGEYDWPNQDAFARDLFPTTVSIRGVGLSNFAQNRKAFYGFVQDSWKIYPRWTLELGLRYEITTTARDSQTQDLNTISSIPSFRDFLFDRDLLRRAGLCETVAIPAACSTHPLFNTRVFDTLPTAHQQAR